MGVAGIGPRRRAPRRGHGSATGRVEAAGRLHTTLRHKAGTAAFALPPRWNDEGGRMSYAVHDAERRRADVWPCEPLQPDEYQQRQLQRLVQDARMDERRELHRPLKRIANG